MIIEYQKSLNYKKIELLNSSGADALIRTGHRVLPRLMHYESGFNDNLYGTGRNWEDPADVWKEADMILKVKAFEI